MPLQKRIPSTSRRQRDVFHKIMAFSPNLKRDWTGMLVQKTAMIEKDLEKLSQN